jgi:tetratricopeptide (TPR) repeat protein
VEALLMGSFVGSGRGRKARTGERAGWARRGASKVRMAVMLALGGGLLVAVSLALLVEWQPVSKLVRQSRDALAQSRLVDAEVFAQRAIRKEPGSALGYYCAGQAAERGGRPEDAVDYYLRSGKEPRKDAVLCFVRAGEILAKDLFRLDAAEAAFRKALELDSQSVPALQGLSLVLRQATRTYEQIPLSIELIRQQAVSASLLRQLELNERLQPNAFMLEVARARHPNDANVMLGEASLLRAQQRVDEGRALLEKVLVLDPKLDEARVRMGMLLDDSKDDARFVRWNADAGTSLDWHPMIWMLRAGRARRLNDPNTAIRCYWEAARRDANLQPAHQQLGLLLEAAGKKEQAASFLKRAARLRDYSELAGRNDLRGGQRGAGDVEQARKAVKSCEELGNYWEACGWARLALQHDSQNPELREAEARLQKLAARTAAKRTDPDANPAEKIDLSSYPLPDWDSLASADLSASAPAGPERKSR